MSSILKALKKLERDNATCKPGQHKIDSNILIEQHPAGISRTTVILLLIFFVAAGSGATYLMMKKQISTSSPTQAPIPPQTAHIPEVVPTASLKRREPETSPVTKKSIPNQIQAIKNKQEDNAKKAPRAVHYPDIPPRQAPATLEKQVSVPQKIEPTIAIPATKYVQPTARPKLTINGIAYQEGSKDNLAVINGNPVSKGSIIEGVKVEEVLGDRVRFSMDGEKFEVILNKLNR